MDDIYIEVPYDVFNETLNVALNNVNDWDNNSWRLSTDAPLHHKDNPLGRFLENTPVQTLFNNKVPAKYSLYLIYGTFITHTITE